MAIKNFGSLTDDDLLILDDLLQYGNPGREYAKRAREIRLDIRMAATKIRHERSLDTKSKA